MTREIHHTEIDDGSLREAMMELDFAKDEIARACWARKWGRALLLAIEDRDARLEGVTMRLALSPKAA